MRTSHWIAGAALVLLVLAVTLTIDPLGLMTQQVDEPNGEIASDITGRAAGGLKGRAQRVLPDADPERWEGEPVGRLVLSLGKATLEGRVVDADGPLRFARVRVALTPPYHQLGVRTRKDGTFEIAGLPDGAHEVRAAAEGYIARTVIAPAVQGEETARVAPIELEPRPDIRSGIRVKVSDVFGRPMPGARVVATTMPWDIYLAMGPEGAGIRDTHAKRGTADELGVVELAPLPAEDYAVVAMAPGYVNAAIDGVVVGGNRMRTVALKLTEGVSVRGRVVDADGGPIENALVTGFAQPSFAASLATRTDAEGVFVLDGLRRGRYLFIGWHETHGSTVQPGESPGNVEIKLAGTGTVTGRVVREDGTPVTDGHVRPFQIGPFQYVYSMVHAIDDQGRFSFHVPAGKWNLRAQAADGTMKDGTMVEVTAGGDHEATITLPSPRVVRGVVMDESGRHVAGAEVFVMQGGMPETPSREQYARTDAEGAFEVRGLAEGTIDLHVVHADHADTKVRATPAPPAEARELSVRLTRGASVVGRVTDSEGNGMPGEQVNIARGWMDARSVLTDAEGAYRFDAVAAGTYSVTTGPFEMGARGLTKRGIVVPEEGEVPVDFVNPAAGGSLTGTVMQGGAPVAGARVTVTDARGPERAVTATADEAGRFSVSDIQFGSVRVSATTANGLRGSQTLTLEEGGSAPDVELRIGSAVVSVRVLGTDGEPAPGCWISIEDAASEDTGWGRIKQNGNTGADGVYTSGGLLPGRYTLRVNRPEFAQHVTPPFDLAENETKTLPDIRMTAGVVLQGVVRDDAGNPIEKATVSLKDLAGRPIQVFSTATSGSDGRYGLHGIEPGRYVAHFQAAGHGNGQAEVQIGEAGATVDMVLTRGGAVAVTVVDPGGAPVPGVDVKLFDGKGVQVTKTVSLVNFDSGQRFTDGRGQASLADLAADGYQIRVTLDGWAVVGSAPRVTIEPGGRTPVTIVMERLE